MSEAPGSAGTAEPAEKSRARRTFPRTHHGKDGRCQERDRQRKRERRSGTGDDDQAMLDTALELTETAQEYWQDNDMDKAFESLDQAYALLLSIPNTRTTPS